MPGVLRPLDLVVNPRAGAGRAARILPEVTSALAHEGYRVEVHRTERPGHAGELVRKLVRDKAPLIGVMGGDGSFHEAIAGTLDETGAPLDASESTFAIVPAGTGGDLRRSFEVPTEIKAMARWVARAEARPFDLGEISYVRHDGEPGRERFSNIASFGVAGVVDKLVNQGPKWLGGKVAFFGASFAANLTYRNVPVRVSVDGRLFYEGPVLNVAVANGRAFGGGMFVAPEADVRDGLLDVVVLGDLTTVEGVVLSKDLYAGMHLGHRKVRHARGSLVKAELLGTRAALLDLDGEAPGRLPATFTVAPSAIKVLASPV